MNAKFIRHTRNAFQSYFMKQHLAWKCTFGDRRFAQINTAEVR